MIAMMDNKYDKNLNSNEQQRRLDMIRESQERQHLEMAIALSLQDDDQRWRSKTNDQRRHQYVPSRKEPPADVVADPQPRTDQQEEERNRIRYQLIQEEQRRILERIRVEQEKEQEQLLQMEAAFLHHGATTQHEELFPHHDRTNGVREPGRHHRRVASNPITPDPMNAQDVENLGPPRVITVITPQEPLLHQQQNPSLISAITTSIILADDNDEEQRVLQQIPSQIVIRVGMQEPQRRRNGNADLNVNQTVYNQRQHEEEPVVAIGQEEENRILKRLLQEQHQKYRALERRVEERGVPQLSDHRPLEPALFEPHSDNAPTQQFFRVGEHSSPPPVISIPQGPLHDQRQNSQVSAITLDNRIFQQDEENEGKGQILIKKGSLVKSPPRTKLPANDVIVTCEGCKHRLQVDRSYSLVFCPKCHTISSAVPVPYVAFAK